VTCRFAVVIGVFVALSGCGTCPERSSDDEAPILKASRPTLIVAHVDSFHDLGAFIDFSEKFVKYHSVVFSTEGAIGWHRVFVQYQGLPIVGDKRLELGQRVQFTLPAHVNGSCCQPYLSEITDMVFLGPR